jgi:hypothetical protein
VFIYFYEHILPPVYILLHTYTSAYLHISTPVYLRMFTYPYTRNLLQAYVLLHHIPIHTYTYIAQVHILPHPASLYISTTIYLRMFTVFYTYQPMHVYKILLPYSYVLHTSIRIAFAYLLTSTRIPVHVYILLSSYSYTSLHSSRSVYRIRTVYVHIFMCTYLLTRIPIHVYILLNPYARFTFIKN